MIRTPSFPYFSFTQRVSCLVFASLILSLGTISSHATSIKIGANAFSPPYVIKESNSGVYLETVLLTLSKLGIESEIIYLSNERVNLFFDKDLIDLALYYSNNRMKGLTIYPSLPILKFRNGFECISKEVCKKIFHKNSGLKLIGFQNANKYVDDKYTSLVKSLGDNYREVENQREQVISLLSGEVDAVFMDHNIFEYFYRELKKINHPGINKNLEIANAAWPNQPIRSVAFKNKELRDKFNLELKKFQASPDFENLLKKYSVTQ